MLYNLRPCTISTQTTGGKATVCMHGLLPHAQMETGTEALIMWKMQFHVENVEVETMKNLTRLLLMNILPQHVAAYYLERPVEEVSVLISFQVTINLGLSDCCAHNSNAHIHDYACWNCKYKNTQLQETTG